VLPILTIPGVLLPIISLTGLGIKNLPLGARWQTWSTIGLSMTLGPFMIILLEVVIGVFIVIGVVAYIVSKPELAYEFQQLSQQFMQIDPTSDQALELLIPLLTSPKALMIMLLYFSVIVPGIEEIFKPIGVWLFAKQIETPAQGFALGALSGAGYALIETLGVSAQVDAWAGVITTRIGTSLLHITTSALMGAGIIAARQQRRYLYLLGVYLAAVILHGVWNATAILFSFSNITPLFELPAYLPEFNIIAGGVMSLLGAALLIILVIENHRNRIRLPVQPEAPVES
jgi:RsiW-degrading membrane proteinase PrsW (M82 family)